MLLSDLLLKFFFTVIHINYLNQLQTYIYIYIHTLEFFSFWSLLQKKKISLKNK